MRELLWEGGRQQVRIACPADLIPSPGQYVLAGSDAHTILPLSLFYTNLAPQGFIATLPGPVSWTPGLELPLRGPLGHGFSLPPAARRVGLLALDETPARLLGLIALALRQDAAVALVTPSGSAFLPDDVEVLPLSGIDEIIGWADYLAFDVRREELSSLRKRLAGHSQRVGAKDAQVLVYTPIPCGGLAECGICAVTVKDGWEFACKDGPVFDWSELESKAS